MARVCIKISEVLTLSLPKLLNLLRCQTWAGGLLHAIVRTITLEARQLYFSMGFAGKNGGAEKTLGVH